MGSMAIKHGATYPIPRGATLVIEGIGDIEIRPGADVQEDDAVGLAEDALVKALGAMHLPDLAAARNAADLRMQAGQRAGEARGRLAGLAPDGIEPLREALARIPEAEPDADILDLVKTRALLDIACIAGTVAQSGKDIAGKAMTETSVAVAGTAATEADKARRGVRMVDYESGTPG